MHHQQQRLLHRLRDRREIAQGVVRHFPESRWIDSERTDAHHQRVTVRRCFRRDFMSDHRARPRAVFDYHLLAKTFRQARRQHARDRIRATGWRGGYDDADGAGGPGLRIRRERQSRE